MHLQSGAARTVVSAVAGAVTGEPAREPELCASVECRSAGVPAEVRGTFLLSQINGRPDVPNVGYCRRCVTVFTEFGVFEPN